MTPSATRRGPHKGKREGSGVGVVRAIEGGLGAHLGRTWALYMLMVELMSTQCLHHCHAGWLARLVRPFSGWP